MSFTPESADELIEKGIISKQDALSMELLFEYANKRYSGKPLLLPFIDAAKNFLNAGGKQLSHKEIEEIAEKKSHVVSPLLAGATIIESMFVELKTEIEEIKRDQIKILQMIDILCDDKKKAEESHGA